MKPFLELYKYDFGKEVRKKPTFFKDKDGKLVKTSEDKWLNYVEWATVLVTLYKVAEVKEVSFSSQPSQTKKNTLEITVELDDLSCKIDYPIIDGNSVISEPNQLQISKAELRGFVKCVAIHTGLGLSLWQKEESILSEVTEKPKAEDNTSEFLDWVVALDNCQNIDDLGKLYNDNKEAFEKNNNVKALFIKRKTELTKK